MDLEESLDPGLFSTQRIKEDRSCTVANKPPNAPLMEDAETIVSMRCRAQNASRVDVTYRRCQCATPVRDACSTARYR